MTSQVHDLLCLLMEMEMEMETRTTPMVGREGKGKERDGESYVDVVSGVLGWCGRKERECVCVSVCGKADRRERRRETMEEKVCGTMGIGVFEC